MKNIGKVVVKGEKKHPKHKTLKDQTVDPPIKFSLTDQMQSILMTNCGLDDMEVEKIFETINENQGN